MRSVGSQNFAWRSSFDLKLSDEGVAQANSASKISTGVRPTVAAEIFGRLIFWCKK
jgi:hypothetical protein